MRYLRLYLYFIRFSVSRALEFRWDLLLRVVMDAVFYATSLAFFSVVYGHTSLIGGWNRDQIYIFICGYFLVDALFMTTFSNNLWRLPILVNHGDLDYYLTRPVSSIFFLSLRDFAVESSVNALAAGGLVAWSLARYPGELGAARIALFLAYLLAGTYLLYLVRLAFVIPVFWVHSAQGFVHVSWALTQLGERPIQIYRPWLRWTLLTVLPFGFIATVPAHVLFDGLSPTGLANLLAVAALGTVGVRAFWRSGLAAYSSASS
ncbi:MAG TPA: ABC-2 family transporter protein [Thermoanaerobaculia bacterium]|nr:ABC-2 family transporter protein [Thermoanaerobaculia bacterium]